MADVWFWGMAGLLKTKHNGFMVYRPGLLKMASLKGSTVFWWAGLEKFHCILLSLNQSKLTSLVKGKYNHNHVHVATYKLHRHVKPYVTFKNIFTI